MIKLKVKPLSVNQAFKGRRHKTDLYKNYAKFVPLLLPKKLKIPKGKLKIHFVFGFSNSNSDWDNPIKQIQDIISKKYKFNDNRIYFGSVEKKIVKKGQEYIEFEITSYE